MPSCPKMAKIMSNRIATRTAPRTNDISVPRRVPPLAAFALLLLTFVRAQRHTLNRHLAVGDDVHQLPQTESHHAHHEYLDQRACKQRADTLRGHIIKIQAP